MKRRPLLLAPLALPFAAAATLPTPAVAATPAAAPAAPAALLERLLDALGGRSAWAGIRTLVNDSQQNRLDEPTVVRAVIRLQMAPLRVRIDTTAPGLVLARVIDGERHWRLNREGRVQPVPEATLADDRRWLAGHVYRTLHRLAAADPALRVTAPEARRLQVWDGDARLLWLALDARGEPHAFGTGDAPEQATVCGPWAFEAGGIRHPVWTARPDGSWRAWLRALQVNADLPAATWQPPAG